jgi:hypothetical protein
MVCYLRETMASPSSSSLPLLYRFSPTRWLGHPSTHTRILTTLKTGRFYKEFTYGKNIKDRQKKTEQKTSKYIQK